MGQSRHSRDFQRCLLSPQSRPSRCGQQTPLRATFCLTHCNKIVAKTERVKRIQGGEAVDLVVLPRGVLDQVLSDGNIVPGTTVDVAQSSMGIGVRADGPKPDISTADGFKRALLAAKAIAVTDPASGGAWGGDPPTLPMRRQSV